MEQRFTVKAYRDQSYINSQGDVRFYYDVCTANKLNKDGSIETELGNFPADKWEEYCTETEKYFN